MPFVHLPAQSGSNEVLKRMGRLNTREEYLEIFNKLKKIENLNVSTDLIVGFPGETREQFEETLSLYEECKYDHAYTFVYSPRVGTPAAKFDDPIDKETKFS
jgi:tRNA-2-methylthio-N6-dimethylallyladenosine synthase